MLWDIGAGSGAVAIELLRAAPRSLAIGLEPDDTRRATARANAAALACRISTFAPTRRRMA